MENEQDRSTWIDTVPISAAALARERNQPCIGFISTNLVSEVVSACFDDARDPRVIGFGEH
jgi:hypothetical protein